jgi:hypothetical protein
MRVAVLEDLADCEWLQHDALRRALRKRTQGICAHCGADLGKTGFYLYPVPDNVAVVFVCPACADD